MGNSQHGRKPSNPQKAPKFHGRKPSPPRPQQGRGSSSAPGLEKIVIAIFAVPFLAFLGAVGYVAANWGQ